MHLSSFYQDDSLGISIEIFPPKSETGDEALFQHLERLIPFGPRFVSCTYGAGGSTRTRTVELCCRIQEQFRVPATAHFTCVGSSVSELEQWLDYASRSGIRNIMALRGDAPKGDDSFQPAEGGLRYANELVGLIRRHSPEMGIGVAGYPETHPEAVSSDDDLANLKRKVDAGADAVYTQLFYRNEDFLRFREACETSGITVPIIPGIMPITEFARIKRITAMCGSLFPEELCGRLEAVQEDADAQFEIGVEHALEQCRGLIAEGIPGIHFYALNKSRACERILCELDVVAGTA